MKVTARQDREPIVDGILSGWKEVNLHLIFSGIILVVEVNSFYLFIFLVLPKKKNNQMNWEHERWNPIIGWDRLSVRDENNVGPKEEEENQEMSSSSRGRD